MMMRISSFRSGQEGNKNEPNFPEREPSKVDGMKEPRQVHIIFPFKARAPHVRGGSG